MAVIEIKPDQKGDASLALGEVIDQTRDNFPDPKYRPIADSRTDYYRQYGIDPSPYQVWVTADGIGTKPELAERMYTYDLDPAHFESLAYDTFAMIDGDVARFGYFLPGIANVVDTNTANTEVIAAIARGAKSACDAGGFAMLNGETAELGYRTSGYGDNRLNWNAFGLMLRVPEKFILGDQMEPGQSIVGFREISIRSNGLSRARAVLEAAFLKEYGFSSKREYFAEEIEEDRTLLVNRPDRIPKRTKHFFNTKNMFTFLDRVSGHSFEEQMLIPWQEFTPEVTKELLRPSTLYGKLMYVAQGGVSGPREVDMTGAAHISGGGVPLKMHRLLKSKGLGAHINAVFPDPLGVRYLFELAENLRDGKGQPLIDDPGACMQWNRGIGFAVVTRTKQDAMRLVDLAGTMNYEAAIVGEVLPEPKIEWRGHTWTYTKETLQIR